MCLMTVLVQTFHFYIKNMILMLNAHRYLHERLQQAEAETMLATQALAKYKVCPKIYS